MTALALALVCAADAACGDPAWMPHPVRAIGTACTRVERILRTQTAGDPRRELVAGGLLCAALAGGTYALAWSALAVARRIDRRFAAGLEIGLAWTTLAARDLLAESAQVATALQRADLVVARTRLARIVGRDTVDLDAAEIARATVETLAESACDGVVAPLFALALGGAPLALAFSVNVNPLGPPPALLRALAAAATDANELARYPEPDGASLRAALGTFLDIEPEAIVVGNGAAALLETALAVCDARRCVVPTPAFSEYGRALTALDAELVALPLAPAAHFALEAARVVEALRTNDAQACIVTNPHNPSGALATSQTIRAVCDDARGTGACTIVDEAFIDYAPNASVASFAASHGGAIVVRSLTKFFAVPALRVGYAVCAPDLARRMRARLPSWPVTTLAMRAVAASLDDRAYADATRLHNERERRRLAVALENLGIRVFPSAANFLLLDLPARGWAAREVAERLVCDARIVVRDASSYDGLRAGCYVRVGVRGPRDNARLVAAFAHLLLPGVRVRGDDNQWQRSRGRNPV